MCKDDKSGNNSCVRLSWMSLICMCHAMFFILQESYVIEYKLVGIKKVVVEYIQVGRTGVNTYMIRIKLL